MINTSTTPPPPKSFTPNDTGSTTESDKFNEMAKEWWDPNGPMKLLHDMNPVRFDFIQNQLGDLNGKKALDVGCGGGILTEALSKAGAQVSGIDLADGLIEVAKKHAASENLTIDYQCKRAESLAEQTDLQRTFDIVTCLELLEHIDAPELLVDTLSKLVKPGGTLFFSTINRSAKAYLMTIIGAEYLFSMLPRGTHEYNKFIQPSELTQWLRNAGSDVTAIKGLRYGPLSGKFTLTDDVSVNYIIAATC